ncbi:MAG: hypothetical protein HY986_15905 [Candidatus Melainabacteria bacterium]|nr:hypothetical protein [Candidatus Melainabacteria bacterium]
MRRKLMALATSFLALTGYTNPLWAQESAPQKPRETMEVIYPEPHHPVLLESIEIDTNKAADTDLNAELAQLEWQIRQTMLKELDLLSLNTDLEQVYKEEKRSAGKGQAAAGLICHTVGEAGTATITAARWHYFRQPSAASKGVFSAGPITLIVSHSLTTANAAAAIATGLHRRQKRCRTRQDTKSFLKRAQILKAEIDENIATLQDKLKQANLSAIEREVFATECNLLKSIEVETLQEFIRISARQSAAFAQHMTYQGLTVLAGASGGYGGALPSLVAVQTHRPTMAIPAGIGFVVSGAIGGSAPILSQAAALAASVRTKAKSRAALAMKENQGENPETVIVASTAQNLTQLERLVAGVDSFSVKRNLKQDLEIFMAHESMLENFRQAQLQEAALARKELWRKSISASLMGGLKATGGILMINAGASYQKHPPKEQKLANSQIFNRRVAEAGTVFTVGPAIGITDSLCAQAFKQIQKRNQKWKNPQDLLAQRGIEIARLKALKQEDAIAQLAHHGTPDSRSF